MQDYAGMSENTRTWDWTKAGIKQAQIVNTGAREPEHLNGKAGKEAETNCGNK